MHIRRLGRVDYADTLAAMHRFTDGRDAATPDELWVLEHPPVFTQGQAGKPEHLLMPGDIPVVQTDRGGQVTYHGPGQLVIYPLVDIARRGYGARSLVTRIEQAMVGWLLDAHGIAAYADVAAPGVYVDVAGARHKLGSIGLRIRQGRSLHGLSLNVAMDLEPFSRINPCGYRGLAMTDLARLGAALTVAEAGDGLAARLAAALAEPSAPQEAAG